MKKPDSILTSNTNKDEWQLELEKVLPRLKVTIKTGMQKGFLIFRLPAFFHSNCGILFLKILYIQGDALILRERHLNI